VSIRQGPEAPGPDRPQRACAARNAAGQRRQHGGGSIVAVPSGATVVVEEVFAQPGRPRRAIGGTDLPALQPAGIGVEKVEGDLLPVDIQPPTMDIGTSSRSRTRAGFTPTGEPGSAKPPTRPHQQGRHHDATELRRPPTPPAGRTTAADTCHLWHLSHQRQSRCIGSWPPPSRSI
jgi:hypothetical protein